MVDGVDVVAEVHKVLDQMSDFVRARALRGSGRATAESGSEMSSISGSAARTSDR